MPQQDFQQQVLVQLEVEAHSEQLKEHSELLNSLHSSQKKVFEKLERLEAFTRRQEDFNAIVAGQFERIDQQLSAQQVLIENEIVERSNRLGEGSRMYTDQKLSEPETAFH